MSLYLVMEEVCTDYGTKMMTRKGKPTTNLKQAKKLLSRVRVGYAYEYNTRETVATKGWRP